ncbi:MAG: hypothetical protein ABIP44_11040 [Pseudoxanthomonas sp.]
MNKEDKTELVEALNKADSREGLALKIPGAKESTGEHYRYGGVFSSSQDASAGF